MTAVKSKPKQHTNDSLGNAFAELREADRCLEEVRHYISSSKLHADLSTAELLDEADRVLNLLWLTIEDELERAKDGAK